MPGNFKIAVVTGGNKGIGYAIVKLLCQKFSGIIYLTARNKDRGFAALAKIKQEIGPRPFCCDVRFYPLDIDNTDNIVRFRSYFMETHGRIDLLINNAAVAFKTNSTVPFAKQAESTLYTNYWGTLAVCNLLYPMLKTDARVVNVASSSGSLKIFSSEKLKKRLLSEKLTVEALTEIAEEFCELAKSGAHKEFGYPTTAYGMSKALVIALTRIQQREFDSTATEERKGITVTSCCPGYVATDMTSHKGYLTPDEGAETPVFLALLDEGDVTYNGQFVREKQIIPWEEL